MDIYLKNEKEKEEFHFPVNPIDKINIKKNKKFETVDIIDFGEADIPSLGKNIKEISFSTLLPSQYYSFCRYKNLPNVDETISKLEKWMEQKEPVRLLITDFNFNELVIISTLDYEERAGEPGDKYINISFRSYRELKIEALPIIQASPQQLNSRPSSNTGKKVHTVKKGDTLWGISKKYFGSGSKWTTIYSVPENKKTIGSNPDLIIPGQRIIIP